jgi:hypothetical protein
VPLALLWAVFHRGPHGGCSHRESGAALSCVFVVVWEVSEEVRGDRRRFGEREQREALAFWSAIWRVLVVRRE